MPLRMAVVSDYQLGPEIASGGMATVLLGRRTAAEPPALVALKRIHPHLAKDRRFVNMFRDEARLAQAIDHPNVVACIELLQEADALLLVLEYVEGVTLRSLYEAARSQGAPIPSGIIAALALGLLAGLDRVHNAEDADGQPLQIIHRDVSPPNVLVAGDGVTKLADFGVAKAVERLQTTREGQVKGKLAYMAPEQLVTGMPMDRRVDLYAVGALLWELLTLRRLFEGAREPEMMMKIITGAIDPPSDAADCDPRWDPLLERALAVDPQNRYSDAAAMAAAIRDAFPLAPASELGAWVRTLAAPELTDMAARREAFLAQSSEAVAAVLEPTPAAGGMVVAARRRVWNYLAAVAAVGCAAAVLVALVRANSVAQTLQASGSQLTLPAAAAATTAVTRRDVAEPFASAARAVPTPPQPGPAARPRLPKQAPKAAADKCASPFYTDKQGVQRVRRECL